jgi:hypothetical protein
MTHETTAITVAEPTRRAGWPTSSDFEATPGCATPTRSVWTGVPCLSLVVIAVWSRTWIGWYCLIPIAGEAHGCG